MPIVILGLVFVVGLFIYYLISTGGTPEKKNNRVRKAPPKPRRTEDYRTEENVIYLSDDIDKVKRERNIGENKD